jgi:hypothetical protein
VKVTIPSVVRESLAAGATRDDVWRFLHKVKQFTIDDDGTVSVMDEKARVALVSEVMRTFPTQVRDCYM